MIQLEERPGGGTTHTHIQDTGISNESERGEKKKRGMTKGVQVEQSDRHTRYRRLKRERERGEGEERNDEGSASGAKRPGVRYPRQGRRGGAAMQAMRRE